MRRIKIISVISVLLLLPLSLRAERGEFERNVVLNKSEFKVGASFLFSNFNSSNSEILLIANNLGANGSIFRVTPGVEYCYRDNMSVGARFAYTGGSLNIPTASLSLFSESLSFSFSDIAASLNTYSGAVYHRNYIGLEKTGTVGFFVEAAFAYSHSTLGFGLGSGVSDSINQKFGLTLSPGFVLYVMNFVSLDLSLSIAELCATYSKTPNQDATAGSRWKVKAACSFDVLNLNFGINFHF